jgi:hypothetical protein
MMMVRVNVDRIRQHGTEYSDLSGACQTQDLCILPHSPNGTQPDTHNGGHSECGIP